MGVVKNRDVFVEAYRDVFMSMDGRYAARGRMPERHTASPKPLPLRDGAWH